MEIWKRDGTPVGDHKAVSTSGGGVMDNFWSHGRGNVEMVRRRSNYSDEFQVNV